MYDVIILGGGPAGAAAGVYAARKRLKSILITMEFGGQSVVSPDIQNWIGTPHISGPDLAASLKRHLEEYADEVLELVEGKAVNGIERRRDDIRVWTKDGAEWTGRALLIATGADRRKLSVPGASEFEHKGVTYCASCDGPIFTGKDVAVIGGGNAGFETAAQLLAYTKSVTLLEYAPSFKADKITVDKVLAHPNMKAIPHAELLEICGENMVTGVRYRDRKNGKEHLLKVEGVFVEIGMVPNTAFAEGVVAMDALKRITVDPRNQRTATDGIWAAGDCTDELYHQNNIAAGDGVKALEDIYVALTAR